ncbi:hypothetical protein GWK47_006202 [Chionoecetes opilio]|uniref:Transposase n=1 Tax=Chionoecetes opilio TaxID=41210 RepID=A0A8J4Y717_CHIOP|nr:hypothetical protein GWK47_006202 [Chionoecetes opilio]
MPCQNVIMDDLLEAKLALMSKLRGQFKDLPDVAFCTTLDVWTARRRSYLGMALHWIDPATLAPQSRALCCKRLRGGHTRDKIATEMSSVLEDFGLSEQVKYMVTDSGGNVGQAVGDGLVGAQAVALDTEEQVVQVLVESVDVEAVMAAGDQDTAGQSLPRRVRCASHTRSLLADTTQYFTTSQDPAKHLYQGMKIVVDALWECVESSSHAADRMHQMLGFQWAQQNPTRWHSTFDAIKSLDGAGAKVNAFLRLEKLPCFSPSHFKVMKEYISLYEPVSRALAVLQRAEAALGCVLPTIATLTTKLHRLELHHLRGLRDHLLHRLELHFDKYKNIEFRMATVLAPRFKLQFEDEASAAQITDHIRRAMESLGHRETGEGGHGKTDGDWDDFFGTGVQTTVGSDVLTRYLYDSRSSLSILQEEQYRPLKTLYVQKNAAPASGAAVDSLFNTAAPVLGRRAALGDDTFELLLFLKLNHFYWAR